MPKKTLEAKTSEPVTKHPELADLKDKLETEKAVLVAKAKPLRDERDKLRAKIQPLEAEERALNAKIKAVELPRMAELDNQISAIARAMGGRSLSEG